MQKLTDWLLKYFNWMNDSVLLGCIRRGFVFSIPVVLAGSVAVLLSGFPIQGYQQFLDTFCNGQLRSLLTQINQGTYGFISIILLITIAYSYGEYLGRSNSDCIIMSTVSVSSFIAFIGLDTFTQQMQVFGSQGLFTAILVSVLSAVFYIRLSSVKWFRTELHSYGSDINFNIAVKSILPGTVIVSGFAVLNGVFQALFHTQSVHDLFASRVTLLFDGAGRNIGSGIGFVLLIHLLWFFGIHGNKVLDVVAEGLFASGLAINMDLLAMNQAPTEIVSKTFIDTFVLMGGCGSTLCLILAIIIRSKIGHVKELAKLATVPVLFNINEIITFGFPIVLNPFMLIPFILTPIVLFTVSYIAVSLGLVPITAAYVEWTTPVLFSGYVATNSIQGSLLQVMNLIIGTAIYLPFVKLSESIHVIHLRNNINNLIETIKIYEKAGREPEFTSMEYLSPTVKMLIIDLKHAIKNDELQMHYQSQVDYEGKIIGAEALLRWNHKLCGFIYPPLIIALAKEGKILDDLGKKIIEMTCSDMGKMDRNIKISINISAEQLDNSSLYNNIKSIPEKYNVDYKRLGIEVTEQIALKDTPFVNDTLSSLRKLGIKLILDDFGMGHSSMVYLQKNKFDVVKLDGALSKDVLTNRRSEEIIKSIAQLSKSLGFMLVAEYVDDVKQRDKLNEIGCEIYQGYLYSRPLTANEFIKYFITNDIKQ